MTIVEKKPVPIYEVECIECKSKIQYKASEVSWCHITCPVCGTSNWASTIVPVRMEGRGMNNIQCRKCAIYTSEWCPKKRDSLDPDLVRDCDYYRGKTNYDRIRGFNEEEMARWMVAEQISAILAFLNGLDDDDLLNDFTEEAKTKVREMAEEKLHWLKEES